MLRGVGSSLPGGRSALGGDGLNEAGVEGRGDAGGEGSEWQIGTVGQEGHAEEFLGRGVSAEEGGTTGSGAGEGHETGAAGKGPDSGAATGSFGRKVGGGVEEGAELGGSDEDVPRQSDVPKADVVGRGEEFGLPRIRVDGGSGADGWLDGVDPTRVGEEEAVEVPVCQVFGRGKIGTEEGLGEGKSFDLAFADDVGERF